MIPTPDEILEPFNPEQRVLLMQHISVFMKEVGAPHRYQSEKWRKKLKEYKSKLPAELQSVFPKLLVSHLYHTPNP